MPKKKQASKFSDELLTPIVIPWAPPAADESGNILLGPPDGRLEQLKKMGRLAAHYKAVKDDGQIDYFVLAHRLAFDLVPGFQVLLDSPIARKAGLSDAFKGRTKPKGRGQLDEVLSGQPLEALFEISKKAWPQKNEVQIAEDIAAATVPGLGKSSHRADRERAGKTLRNRLSRSRKSARSDGAGE